MPGILYVVATPIGNLEDVTLRALRILREVSLIAAEDTRRTGQLLQHYSISTRTTSLHAHNEHEKTPALLRQLVDGASIAVVSDAGTPIVSDPGHALVAQAAAAGIRVEAIPGPSSVLAIISSSPIPAPQFKFLGYCPVRSKDRNAWFAALLDEPLATVFFEAPHRIEDLFGQIAKLGPTRRITVGRELTKAHESVLTVTVSQLAELTVPAKGEFTLLLEGAPVVPHHLPIPDANGLRRMLGEITEAQQQSKRHAMKLLAEQFGITVNDLYRRLEAEPDMTS